MSHGRTFILLAAMTALFMGVGYLLGGAAGMAVAFVIAAAMNLFSYWNSDKIVLKMHGAQAVDETDPNPMIRAYVSDTRALAARAGLPEPKIYVMDTGQPNAFATGRDPANAAVAATRGLLQALTREEVAGVMAHELAHVKHRDTLTMTLTATVAGAIGMLANFVLLFGGNRERGGMITAIAVAFLAPLAASVVQMAISRSREYEADKLGAEICGNPLWLASALEKIEREARAMVNPQAERNPASAHLFIINPLRDTQRDKLFSTHPSTANRVAALRELAVNMGVAGKGGHAPADRFARDSRGQDPRARGPWG